ncbi:Glycoside hydrolase, superfamily [Artemisia annua]|uniref:Glycoside hydrolase, superfamily n=1 Tax=Artemisia annua TaxID=35608 RepID=A0A2U1NYI8_ARTAN|nr:Glycoside hydrolase, superfamily [Artemisia annua]
MEAQNSNDVRTVEIRSRPKMLTETIASMTTDQKQVVKSMGFGGVLGLKLKSLSKDFVLFVIDQLDPVQMVLHTHNGDIPINRLAVHEVYGFPMGHKKFISRHVTNYNSELGELWKEHTKKNSV